MKSGFLSETEVAQARERLREAMHLQEIEGNPLDRPPTLYFPSA